MKWWGVFGVVLLSAQSSFAQEPVEVVRAVKAALVAQQFDFHLVPESDPDGSEESRCGAFAITGRSAYALSRMGYAVFLIGKSPGQNGCTYHGQRYSHDAIIVDGQCVDILFRSETQNVPAWNLCQETPAPAQWRPVVAMDQEVVPTPGPIVPTPGTPPPAPPAPVLTDDDVVEQEILTLLKTHVQMEEAHWANVKGAWEKYFKPFLTFTAKYIAPAVAGWVAGVKAQ